ncbi:NADH dehydrogenase subunit 2 (mitochondrion) [Penicillium digitatum PHI26]|uniref:NADH-ubiquinone oxidoreductase chain 2 n=3 Tax=Penicillium digitatum TaxID=36651 RepID=K9FSH5_PEND2|nr:NADH dehydrogenase subunit 2 [Penicillium digitatum]ADU57303.1 NADH dehydrogenase subunit 2 [Penicillium digitatum]EKV03996.1 NADH dehydrogenase subunit 2 [Penicillium digitatum Pd1]EKV04011.1 NADH dehydrogenase subunit 2 [Penicillium digitatum PHI26]
MLLSSIFCLILSNALSFRRDTAILYSRIGIIILFYCIYLCYNNLFITYLDNGIGLFGGLFYTSPITQTFHILIFIITLLILNLTGFYPRKLISSQYLSLSKLLFTKLQFVKNIAVSNIILKKGEQYTILEYTLMLLFIVIGSLLLISSSDFVSIFLSIELQSYGLYLLCTMYRNSESATSAGLTYFLLGGLASCFILLGIALIYANLGVTYLDSFYVINNLAGVLDEQLITTYIPYCLLLITIGLLFKISAAPFHFWSPDVYDAIPTIVTTFVAIIAKISILTLLLQLVHYTNSIYITTQYTWTTCLLISSLLSLIIGTVLGLTQFRIKRLFAYSTISHLGFMLLALTINSVESIQSFIFYLAQYSLSNLNAFILLIAIGYSLYAYNDKNINHNNLIDKNNSPIQLISQLKGYFHINSLLALSLTITLFSFAGIPPLMGFFAKQMVFSAALQEGFIFLTLIGLLTSVISAVYYLFIVKTMFYDGHSYTYFSSLKDLRIPALILQKNKVVNKIYFNSNFALSSCLSITISILTLIILLFMFMPNETLHLSNILAIVLFIPVNI